MTSLDCWREDICIDFAHFDLESGIVFEETNSKRLRKKEKYANSKWILRIFRGWCSNPSNDGIIY